MHTLVQQLFETARKKPTYRAIIVEKREITYGNLANEVWSTKNFLELKFDVNKGDTVILSAEKNESFVFFYYALHLIGARVVPLDRNISLESLSYVVNSVKPKIAIGIGEKDLNLKSLNLESIIDTPHVPISREIHFPEITEASDIMFTSGTTGLPKGVVLSHENIAQSVKNINGFIKNSAEDIELLALPISHSFGLARLRCVLAAGGTIVLHGNSVNVRSLFKSMETHKVTGFSMVPSSWKYIKKLSGNKLGEFKNQLKYIELGSAYLSADEKQELADLLPNTRLCMHYGLTEASRSAFIEFNRDKDHLYSVGRATSSVDIKIMDNAGNEVPKGNEGEICIAGKHVAKSFINTTNSTSFFGEYLRTGDIGLFNNNGYLKLTGRSKDIINVGGKKLSPVEVEDKVRDFDNSIEVACVGIVNKSSILGEEVKLFVVEGSSKYTFHEINEYLKGCLEDYKVPRYYEWISELPRTSSGKIQRQKLK